jgi:hypothetical protein
MTDISRYVTFIVKCRYLQGQGYGLEFKYFDKINNYSSK